MRDDHGKSNALAGYDNIREMVAALECDYDRLEELRNARDNRHNADLDDALTDEDAEELAELEDAAGAYTDREEAENAITGDALEVCIRSDWYSPTDKPAPSEFYILLSTGGPALRIRGELNSRGEPSRAWLEYQDWGTPWTQLINDSNGESVDQDVLLTYAQCFYFGEG